VGCVEVVCKRPEKQFNLVDIDKKEKQYRTEITGFFKRARKGKRR
jgi:hypothetical protein